MDLEECVELFVQSLHLDVADLFEAPESVTYPENRRSRTTHADNSVVGEVDKAVLLEVLEQELDDESAKAEALSVAHTEDISAWVEVIAHYLDSKQAESVSLVELAKQVKYPIIQEEKKGSSLVKTWIALLLGGFTLSQCNEFYDPRGIRVGRSYLVTAKLAENQCL